ncbi:hypothetical protein QWY84_10670 [Aquisalimonas lutea]|uniref:hypothetical protein n=1 Tax=Aquisalimonas lutea TaxID=1327750 RepID=UPI0025B4E43F|nr:hypothetical protein [Aquisalimonas lutea]MDN3518073.1 hypothetical protein [Aquisalimonas lutea]
MTESITKEELATRWECTLEGVDFAVRSGFIPAPLKCGNKEYFNLKDVLRHELKTQVDVPERLVTIAGLIRNEMTSPEIEQFKAETEALILENYSESSNFQDIMKLYREVTQ